MPRGRSASPSQQRGGNALSRSFRRVTGKRPPPRPRGRSGSPGRGRGGGEGGGGRGRSASPSARRGRSGSPSARRGRSASPSAMRGGGRGRSRSGSPSRGQRPRSASPGRERHGDGRGREGGGGERGKRRRARESVHRVLKKGTGAARKGGGAVKKGLKKGGKRINRSRIGQTARKIAPPEKCSTTKCLCYLVPIILLLVSSIGLIVATGNASKITPDAIRDILPDFDFANINDPFAGDPANVPKWRNGGTEGLDLEFLNSLQDSWQVEFQLAVADWDFGNPDALTLTTTNVDYDYECTQVEGKVKVCNGDYGASDWRGINNAMLDSDGYIVSSAAKMNEFYLQHDSDGARQYTMCHELGHALGLPHTDECFENEDLGNCMDYTFNWDVNKHPDETNYEFLSSLYGIISGARVRSLRTKNFVNKVPTHITSQMSEAVRKLEKQRMGADRDGWRLLHHSIHGEEHELELGEGYKARVHFLHAY